MATGGDIIEITYNHPVIGSGVFYPKSSEDSTFDTGGFRSNDDDKSIDGAGNMIDQITRGRWSFAGTISWDANVAQELEQLVALCTSPVLGTYTFTSINGTVYQGLGKPVGDIKGNGNTAQASVKFAGSGQMQQI